MKKSVNFLSFLSLHFKSLVGLVAHQVQYFRPNQYAHGALW